MAAALARTPHAGEEEGRNRSRRRTKATSARSVTNTNTSNDEKHVLLTADEKKGQCLFLGEGAY